MLAFRARTSLSTSVQAKPGNKATPESGPVETGPTGPVATALFTCTMYHLVLDFGLQPYIHAC